ncbi:hypothetical protein MP228_005978 [Amoeboaphelidium protococcarum]|nr:hypothetical protein MP228_005978 [Amoeboaphelidium protococcarum]
MDGLKTFVDKQVIVITYDGRLLVGELVAVDAQSNIAIGDAIERLFSREDEMQLVPLGTQIIKSTNVATVSLINEDVDSRQKWQHVRAEIQSFHQQNLGHN